MYPTRYTDCFIIYFLVFYSFARGKPNYIKQTNTWMKRFTYNYFSRENEMPIDS